MTKKLLIEGMSCGHCVKHVKEALQEVKGVSKVDVDLASKTALVEGSAEANELKAAVEDAGYEVVDILNA
jgi:copper chaperone